MKDEIKKLSAILLKENPILFLGAGFSFGGKLKTGENIPLGNGIKFAIIEKLLKLEKESDDYKELSSYSLSQVSQYCSDSGYETELIDFLTDYFSQTVPADYHYKLTDYYWSKIYTTNIDDLVEEIYKKNKNDLIVQQYKRKYTHKKDKATEYFKLHGSVNNPSEGYTFSNDNYVTSMIQSRDYRFSSLGSDMHSEHIIFVGSTFEEINLDYYLKLYENTGYATSRGKVFFINPKPNLLLKTKIKRIQGTLIEWNTERFINFLSELKDKSEAKINKYDLEKDIRRIGFINLKDEKEILSNIINYNSNLYLGFEPQWEDIYEEWDFINDQINEELQQFFIASEDEKTTIVSLYGKAYIGKSTFLKRIAVDMNKNGIKTFVFKGRHFNYFPFLQYLKKSETLEVALIVDNAAYYYLPLRHLVRAVPNGKKLFLITASRPYPHFRWRYNFVGENWKEIYIEPKISDSYAQNIYNRLKEKGFLGDLKKLKLDEERTNEIKKNNDVMSSLFSLTYGKGFVSRLNKDLKPVLEKNADARDLLVSIAIFNKLELADFPIEIINSLYKLQANKMISLVESFIKNTNDQNIQLRSGFFTRNILSSVKKKKIIANIKDLLIVIASKVNDHEHTYWNEIHAALSKEKSLRRLFGISSPEIKTLLYDLRSYYSDNFNYWIQIGIAEQRGKEYEKALNHFRQAESLRPKSYMVKNAIGRNFLKQANDTTNHSVAKKYFKEGEVILLNLIKNREEYQARSFSTHCYLNEKIKYIQQFKLKCSNKELQEMYGYLKQVFEKDPDDVMAKHINNVFFRFLKKINRLSQIKIKFQDISRLKGLFQDYQIDLDNFIDEFDNE